MLNRLSMARVLARVPACLLAILLFAVAGGQAASAASFVDPALGDVTPEKRVVVAQPKPVQLLFTFETNGKLNARATDFVKKDVLAAVKNTGAFSEVSEKPVDGGAVLSITLDNVFDLQKAKSDGVAIGLTFGLKGKLLTDDYVVVGEFIPDLAGAKITRTVKHQIHTTIGRASLPEGVKGVKTPEAVSIMVRQTVENLVNQLAADPGFAPQPPAAAAPAPATATVAQP
jgi:hypothetical protein